MGARAVLDRVEGMPARLKAICLASIAVGLVLVTYHHTKLTTYAECRRRHMRFTEWLMEKAENDDQRLAYQKCQRWTPASYDGWNELLPYMAGGYSLLLFGIFAPLARKPPKGRTQPTAEQEAAR